jgi:hypothetical protein
VAIIEDQREIRERAFHMKHVYVKPHGPLQVEGGAKALRGHIVR